MNYLPGLASNLELSDLFLLSWHLTAFLFKYDPNFFTKHKSTLVPSLLNTLMAVWCPQRWWADSGVLDANIISK
jgi:hypothetical protein